MSSRALALPVGHSAPPGPASLLRQARRQAHSILGKGSKSFALAGLLLGKRERDDAAVLYAWCRRADDRVDDARPGESETILRALGYELDDVCTGRVDTPLDLALHELVVRRRIPRDYFQALLDGFAMDAKGTSYATLADLDLYAYRVAGVVGLMMCHVLGVRDERCLRAAACLGMAMQLTNIARDVAEDFDRGRQYLPSTLVAPADLGIARHAEADHPSRSSVAAAVAALLRRADGYYASGLTGLRDLGWRNAVAIGAAARIYHAIGRVLRARRLDPFGERAVVSSPRKLLLAISALFLVRPRIWRAGAADTIPRLLVRFEDAQA